MSAHTPGPWSAFIATKTVAVDVGPVPTGAGKCVVCWNGFDSSGQTLAVQKANARLIAAAPDLLAVAKMIDDGPHDAEAIADMLPAVRAAIAKAEGKT